MENRSVFIATPAYGGQVAIQYVGSLLATCSNLTCAGVKVVTSLVHGGPYIESERNHAIRRFLATDCTHLLFIDSDLEWQADAALRLLNRDKPIIAGLYPFKSDKAPGFPVRPYGIETDGILPCEGLPTGFMLIKREAIEQMIAAYPELEYTENGNKLACLFQNITKDGQFWGEDYIFCQRWTALGGELWAETDLTFSHCGSKAWKGNYSKRG